MIHLPEAFTQRMEQLLGEEYPDFLASYEQTRRYGLRVNTAKIEPEAFEQLTDFHLRPVNFIPGAYEYAEEDHAARHPYYHAGLYYLQEPSAMTPASVLPVQPGDRVLDLCAAPGGKATALGARLRGKGLLAANDLSASRCKALLKNLEVFGIPNVLVTNEPPARLAERFPEFFDSILVDAPCSGEGMFRKDENTVKAWYPEKPAECAKVQKEIILQAAAMLAPGGSLLYSTCTFSVEENEEVIAYLLEKCPDIHLTDIPERPGFSAGLMGLEQCVRLWPHKTGGEGHFLALLRKDGGRPEAAAAGIEAAPAACPAETAEDVYVLTEPPKKRKAKDRRMEAQQKRREKRTAGKSPRGAASLREKTEAVERFFEQNHLPRPEGRIEIRGEMAVAMPEQMPLSLAGITFLRAGLLLGQFRNDRFEPSQALAMALQLPAASAAPCAFSMEAKDERLMHYLRGETISLTGEENALPEGWILVCVDGFPLGWARHTGSLLKNKYLPGWRTKY